MQVKNVSDNCSDNQRSGASNASANAKTTNARPPRVLAVGEVCHWHMAGRILPRESQIKFADISDIDTNFLDDLNPGIVLTCLVCRTFDFLDLAALLHRANYQGQYRIVSPKLPNPAMVINEARTLFPSLNMDFAFEAVLPQGRVN